jgi:hypothetical protein
VRSTSLVICAPPYCEGLQSLASTNSIIVWSDARPFNYDGIRSQFCCLFLNSTIHCIFCRNRCSERAYWSDHGKWPSWLSKKYLDVR